MTLCMAIACEHKEEPRIVLCNDWKEESQGIGSAEHTDKQNWIADGWPVLTAGKSSQIEELVRLYRSHMAHTNLTENNYLDEFKEPAKQYKGVLAEDYIQHLLGVGYAYFLEHGKNRFPDEFFRDHVSEIGQIKIEASLIIAGFLQGDKIGNFSKGLFPVICVVEDNGEHDGVVHEEIHFAAIGSGTWTANAALYNRGAHDEIPVMLAVYAAFEAHKLSEKVPGVGESVSIDVLEPEGVIRPLSDEGYEYCEFLWRKFGPKELRERHKSLFEIKEDYLEPKGL